MIRTVLFALFFATILFAAGNIPDWQNPRVFQINQTPSHTPLAGFDSVEQAVKSPFKKSPYVKLLNGEWDFCWNENPQSTPADFYLPNYNISQWNTIDVPGCWQMQGFGYAKFRNVHQPFVADPPKLPTHFNPVGLYRKNFTVPEHWDGRQLFLHFEGVKSASYIYLNGKYIGFNQGGMEEFEFDITDLVQPGENILAAQIHRYSAETYLECQDMWRLSGIYRDVYLLSTPDVHIQDYYVHSDLDKKYKNAVLTVEVNIAYSGSFANFQVRATLSDMSGEQIAQFSKKVKAAGITKLDHKIKNPKKWSAEYPNLYKVTLELLDPDGNLVEAMSTKTGFKKVEVIDQAICVNGVPIKFNGVNSHVHHPETGRMMDVETMRKDLLLMKQFNINCVRTSHYPPNIEYLELADELGIYVIDETNDESHATEYVSEDETWLPMYLDRVQRMVIRDRNHPCIVFWSAGNESGFGDNIAKVIERGKELDPSRPIWMYGGNFLKIWYEDIIGPRYPTPEGLQEIGNVSAQDDQRPSFMDEYLAATGNSLGMLDEYWQQIYAYPRLTGGAIWDWISPGITRDVFLTPDHSGNDIMVSLHNRAHLVNGKFGNALALSGQDDWAEAYRDPQLDITGKALSLSLWLFPREWNGYRPLITKGDHQFGLRQVTKDSLEFYIFNQQRISAFAVVPENWEFNWHHLAAVYDGEALQIFIDGELAGNQQHSGSIQLNAFALAIGKNTETHGQEHPGELCNAVIDQVRVFDSVQPVAALYDDSAENAVLALDFDNVKKAGKFYSLGIGGRSYGLIWGDRSVQPEMYQLKKTPQPVHVKWLDEQQGVVLIKNTHHFKNLKEYDCSWELQQDGMAIKSGKLDLDIPAQSEQKLIIPMNVPSKTSFEYFLAFHFRLSEKTAWAEKGYEVAWEQLPFTITPQKQPAPLVQSELSVTDTDAKITVSGYDFSCTFNKKIGSLTSLLFAGKELVKKGPELNAFRAPTANETERSWGALILSDEWRASGLDLLQHKVESVDFKTGNPVKVIVDVASSAPGYEQVIYNHFIYHIFSNGEIQVEHQVDCQGEYFEWIPRLGMNLLMNDAFDYFSWYGRGPFETYPDRKSGAKIAMYGGLVDEQYVPYIIPQDYGNKTDVRWAALTNTDGLGLFVQGEQLLNVSAQHYSTDHLDRACYSFQLKKQDGITLNLDHRISGVGGTPVKTPITYRVQPGKYSYKVRLLPFDSNKISAHELSKQEWQK